MRQVIILSGHFLCFLLPSFFMGQTFSLIHYSYGFLSFIIFSFLVAVFSHFIYPYNFPSFSHILFIPSLLLSVFLSSLLCLLFILPMSCHHHPSLFIQSLLIILSYLKAFFSCFCISFFVNVSVFFLQFLTSSFCTFFPS